MRAHTYTYTHAKNNQYTAPSCTGSGHAYLSKRGSDFILKLPPAADLFPRDERCWLCDPLLYRAPGGLKVNPKTSGDTKSARSATNSVRPDFPILRFEKVSSSQNSSSGVAQRCVWELRCVCAAGEQQSHLGGGLFCGQRRMYPPPIRHLRTPS